MGACYLARQLDELETWALALNKRKIIGYLDLHLGSGGLIRGDRIVKELRRLFGPLRIEDLRIPFVAIATDLVTGHEVWLQKGDLVEAVRASLALPGFLTPMEIEERWLADGALVDPLPVAACRALGADMVVAVNLNTDVIGKSRRPAANVPVALGFDPLALTQGNIDTSPPPLPDSLTRGIFQRDGDKPNIFGVMTVSLSIMQDRLTRSRLAGDPPPMFTSPPASATLVCSSSTARKRRSTRERRPSNASASSLSMHCRSWDLAPGYEHRRACKAVGPVIFEG